MYRRGAKAFTLIEMIGVLAVIAILASLLIPRVFTTIAEARVNGTMISCNTVKTAIADHVAKYNKLEQVWGTNAVTFASGISPGYDTNVLMVEGLLDKPFLTKVVGGSNPQANSIIEIVQGGHENNNAANGYALDGVNDGTAGAQFVIEAKLIGVSAQDAKDLNDRIDGPNLGAVDLTTADNMGQVEYAAPVNGTTTVYIYLMHQ
jgi:prepilin-type N-terminal cleavage/methylation domain-containing protein